MVISTARPDPWTDREIVNAGRCLIAIVENLCKRADLQSYSAASRGPCQCPQPRAARRAMAPARFACWSASRQTQYRQFDQPRIALRTLGKRCLRIQSLAPDGSAGSRGRVGCGRGRGLGILCPSEQWALPGAVHGRVPVNLGRGHIGLRRTRPRRRRPCRNGGTSVASGHAGSRQPEYVCQGSLMQGL